MALALIVVFYVLLLAVGYYVMRWARKPWYPRFMAEMLLLAVVATVGLVVWVNISYDAARPAQGEPE